METGRTSVSIFRISNFTALFSYQLLVKHKMGVKETQNLCHHNCKTNFRIRPFFQLTATLTEYPFQQLMNKYRWYVNWLQISEKCNLFFSWLLHFLCPFLSFSFTIGFSEGDFQTWIWYIHIYTYIYIYTYTYTYTYIQYTYICWWELLLWMEMKWWKSNWPW